MIDALKEYLHPIPENQKINCLREYLQWIILKIMDEQGYRQSLAFVGGTALRLIYKTARFSENLDFSLIAPKPVDFHEMATNLQKNIHRYGLQVDIARLRSEKTVHSFFLRFPDILTALNLAIQRQQLLSIKVESDSRPPEGWKLEEFLFQDPLLFWVTHFDLPSLFAVKLHAFFFRRYDKGRDFYDLIFFLRKKVHPNLALLQNAAAQTNPETHFLSLNDVFSKLADKIHRMNSEQILKDVRPFLLDPGEERFLTPQTALKLLEQMNAPPNKKIE